MQPARRDGTGEILREAQRRVPAGQRFAQEAFTSDHRRPVYIKLNELKPDTFYVFDEITACALSEAVVDWAARHGGGRLTVSCPTFGELKAKRHRLQHLSGRLGRIRVLSVGKPGATGNDRNLEVHSTDGGVLSRFRLALKEGNPAALFICHEQRGKSADKSRCVGFFTFDDVTVNEIADDVDATVRGRSRRVITFERLQLLHQTTQKVVRELESYSRRMELAIRRAQRRPDLLTPARFDRIVRQSIKKIEQLKEIPRRALRALGRR